MPTDNAELRIILSEEGSSAPPAQETLSEPTSIPSAQQTLSQSVPSQKVLNAQPVATPERLDVIPTQEAKRQVAEEKEAAKASEAAQAQSAKAVAADEAAGMRGAMSLAGEAGPLLAAAGPIGAVIAAAALAQKKVTEALDSVADHAHSVADGLSEMARNDNLSAVGRAAKMAVEPLEKIPIVGDYLKRAFDTIGGSVTLATQVIDSFVSRGKELEQFSGPLAGAGAMAEVRSMLADIREARELGPDLARLTDAQSRLEADLREMLLPIKEFVVQHLANALENISGFIERNKVQINIIIEILVEMAKDTHNLMLYGPLGVALKSGAKWEEIIARAIAAANEQKQDEEGNFAEGQLAAILGGNPGPAAGPWDNPFDAQRMAANQNLGIPAIQGLVN